MIKAILALLFLPVLCRATPVAQIQGASYGTTFFISKTESISAKHVCSPGLYKHYIRLKKVYITKKVILSKKYDLCYIQWSSVVEEASPVKIANALILKEEPVYYSGYPYSIFTMAQSILETETEVPSLDTKNYYCKARLNAGPGASGSPVFNIKNEVIGVISMIDLDTKTNFFVCQWDLIDFLKTEVKR